jgi:hypothetical protein
MKFSRLSLVVGGAPMEAEAGVVDEEANGVEEVS